MSTDIAKPWLDVELTEDTRLRTPSDQILEILKGLFIDDVEDVRALAKSPDNEDSVTGDVFGDRIVLSYFIKKSATSAQPWVMNATPKEIRRRLNGAARRIGLDRMAIAAKKAETLAIQQSDAVGPVDEPGLNSRRDVVIDNTAQPE